MNYNIGENNPSKRPEVRRKISESMTGKHHSEETKRKMSEAKKGRKFTKAHRQNLSKAKKGILPKNHWEKGHAPTAGCWKSGKAHPLFGKRGSEVPNWKGGYSRFPYSFDFDEKLKELIRQRDNHTCQLCGKNREENGRKFCIHHIDYIKEDCNPTNLITLCVSCNSKVNRGRSHWTKFFQLKLKLKKAN